MKKPPKRLAIKPEPPKTVVDGHRIVTPDGREIHLGTNEAGLVFIRFMMPRGKKKVVTKLCLSNDGAGRLLKLLMHYAAMGKILPPPKAASQP